MISLSCRSDDAEPSLLFFSPDERIGTRVYSVSIRNKKKTDRTRIFTKPYRETNKNVVSKPKGQREKTEEEFHRKSDSGCGDDDGDDDGRGTAGDVVSSCPECSGIQKRSGEESHSRDVMKKSHALFVPSFSSMLYELSCLQGTINDTVYSTSLFTEQKTL